MKYLAAILLLCSLASGADPSTGPVFGIWHIDGHGYQWQLDQIDAGLPIEASIRMPNATALKSLTWGGSGNVTNITGQADYLRQFDGRGIVLRLNNPLTEMDQRTIPRIVPLTADNYQQSALCIARLADGTLDDQKIMSPLGAIEPWAEAGRIWGQSPWMQRLVELIPDPEYVIWLEDTESYLLTIGSLYRTNHVVRKDRSGFVPYGSDWPNDPLLYKDEKHVPLLATDFLGAGWDSQLFYLRWKTPEEIAAIDIRLVDWVDERRGRSPVECAAELNELYRPCFAAMYAGFSGQLPASWQRNFQTCSYRESRFCDTQSQQWYTAYHSNPRDVTDPKYLSILDGFVQHAADDTWSELSMQLDDSSVFASVIAGTGDVIDAESYAGWCLHACWRLQRPGKAVRLRWFESSTIPPTALMVSGHPETIGDYEVAVMQAMQTIHTHSRLRDYWQRGTTVPLASANNDAAVTRVYAVESTIPGNHRTLIHVYTPCSSEQAPELYFGDHSVQWARSAYYLTNPLEPLPDDVPLTLEQRLERLERTVFGERH